jgi:hypothetical protein
VRASANANLTLSKHFPVGRLKRQPRGRLTSIEVGVEKGNCHIVRMEGGDVVLKQLEALKREVDACIRVDLDDWVMPGDPVRGRGVYVEVDSRDHSEAAASSSSSSSTEENDEDEHKDGGAVVDDDHRSALDIVTFSPAIVRRIDGHSHSYKQTSRSDSDIAAPLQPAFDELFSSSSSSYSQLYTSPYAAASTSPASRESATQSVLETLVKQNTALMEELTHVKTAAAQSGVAREELLHELKAQQHKHARLERDLRTRIRDLEIDTHRLRGLLAQHAKEHKKKDALIRGMTPSPKKRAMHSPHKHARGSPSRPLVTVRMDVRSLLGQEYH